MQKGGGKAARQCGRGLACLVPRNGYCASRPVGWLLPEQLLMYRRKSCSCIAGRASHSPVRSDCVRADKYRVTVQMRTPFLDYDAVQVRESAGRRHMPRGRFDAPAPHHVARGACLVKPCDVHTIRGKSSRTHTHTHTHTHWENRHTWNMKEQQTVGKWRV